MREISLYVHIPFCKRRCSYCTFYHVPHIEEFESAFVDMIVGEIRQVAEEIGEPFHAPTVFFGGGTPSVVERSLLDRIFAAVAPFLPGDRNAEITFEMNPEDVTGALLDHLVQRGVNRVSLGIQAMQAPLLTTLRRCSPQTNQKALRAVSERFSNFSVDVLLGIPGGSVAAVSETLDAVGVFSPAHYSVYCLEPGGAMQAATGDFFDHVDMEESAEQYGVVCDELGSRDYRHYEVSNFARDGLESRHNRVYWHGGEYLGVGPGAHSFIDDRRFHNTASLEVYLSTRGRRQVQPRDAGQRRLERIMLALRTSEGVAMEWIAEELAAVDDLVRSGLARVCDGRLVLTDPGFLLLDEIVVRLTRAA